MQLSPETLQCPVCAERLESTRACASCGTQFLTSKGLPVLIDFADSIFTPQDYATPTGTVVPRLQQGSRVGRFLDRLTYGVNRVAERNVGGFIARMRALDKPRVLVVGGGSVGSGIDALYDDDAVDLVGIDVFASPHISLICDGHRLPFVAESFDGVIIQAVLEHVVEPERVVGEIHRVLKPKGLVYAETPFMQQVHEQAYDFTRFTATGHRWLFRRFDEVDAGPVLGPGVALLWSITHFVRALGGSRGTAALIAAPFFWLRLLDGRIRSGRALDAASGLYFLGTKSESSLPANALPAYYRRKQE